MTSSSYPRAPRRINARRRRFADELRAELAWRGGKVIDLTRLYRVLERRGLRPYDVDRAADDLYAAGLADLRYAGDCLVIEEGGAR